MRYLTKIYFVNYHMLDVAGIDFVQMGLTSPALSRVLNEHRAALTKQRYQPRLKVGTIICGWEGFLGFDLSFWNHRISLWIIRKHKCMLPLTSSDLDRALTHVVDSHEPSHTSYNVCCKGISRTYSIELQSDFPYCIRFSVVFYEIMCSSL